LKGRRAHILLSVLLLTVMLTVIGGSSARAQRVYADTQTSSTPQILIVVTLSEVQNQSNATGTSNFSDYSTLFTTLGALSLIEAWQNLKFPTQPPSNSPLTIKFGANTSVADVINGISIQPTLNGTLVGSAYTGSTILGLLGSGTIDKEITLPAPGVAYNGVRYKVSPSVLGVAVSGRYYYAFYITPPTAPAATICTGSTATLSVTNPQSGYTYNWYNSSGTLVQSNTTSTYTTAALTASTSYAVEAVETSTGTSYFSGRTSIAVTVNNQPTVANAGTNQSLCSVTSTTLTGNTAAVGTGAWSRVSGPNTPTITTPASATTTVTGMIAGTYVFRWTITNTPCPASTSDVTVVVGAPVTASNAGTTQNLCNASGTTLAGNTPSVGTGTWAVVSGPNIPSITFTNPNSGTSTVTGMVPGNYVFSWTISSGSCPTSSSTVNVNNSATPTVASAGTNQNLCSVTTATLAGNSPTVGTGAWTQISGPNTASITAASAANSGLTALTTGTYVFRWTISNSPCPASTSDVSITISTPPTTASAGPNQLLCSVTSTTLAGNSAVSGMGAWSLVSGPNTPVITTPAANNSTVTGLITGTYVLRWTISNGACTPSTSDVTITVGVTPTVTLGTFPSACREITSAMLAYTGTTGSPVTYSITWAAPALTAGFTNVSNVGLPASPITITVPVSAPVATYNGTIKVKNATGCESTAVPFTMNVHPKPASPSFSVTTN